MSHPIRVRGLKPQISDITLAESVVAPNTGAWIETRMVLPWFPLVAVAPNTGAWIET